MATRMILSDGTFVYPSMMDKTARKELYQKLKNNPAVTMRCGCRNDIILNYFVTNDMRFMPCQHGYEHNKGCDRYNQNDRETGYVNQDNGEVVAYISFDPKTFSIASAKSATTTKAQEDSAQPQKIKDCAYNLNNFVKAINYDTYTSRLIDGKAVFLSESYFASAVYGRTKKIYINRLRKTLGSLTLNDDKVQFFYSRLVGVSENLMFFENPKGKDIDAKYSAPNAKGFSVFTFPELMERREKQFNSQYGESLASCISDNKVVMAAGFIYRTKNKSGKEYTCVGRVFLFLVNKNGLYCERANDVDNLNVITEYCKKCGATLLFPDSPSYCYDWIVKKGRKEVVIYSKSVPAEADDKTENAIVLEGHTIDYDVLNNYLKA